MKTKFASLLVGLAFVAGCEEKPEAQNPPVIQTEPEDKGVEVDIDVGGGKGFQLDIDAKEKK